MKTKQGDFLTAILLIPVAAFLILWRTQGINTGIDAAIVSFGFMLLATAFGFVMKRLP